MEYPVHDLINEMNFMDNKFQTLKNGLMLTNWEISVLDKYSISYENCKTLKDVLFEIENVLFNLDGCEELERISISISERDYYQNTNF